MDQAPAQRYGDSTSPSQSQGDSNSSANSPEGQLDPPTQPEKTREKNANRACEACRRLKVRCLPPPADQPDQKCKRCAKNSQECIFLPRSRTRRRKRIDTRVGELENQIKALSSHFQKQGSASEDFQASLAAFNDVSSEIGRRSASNGTPTSASKVEQRPLGGPSSSFMPGSGDAQNPRRSTSSQVEKENDSHASLAKDVIGRGFLSMKEATGLYQRFIDEAVEHCSIVIAPKGLTAAEARRSKPMLFLAIIAAMAATHDPSLGHRLNEEITKVYADRIFLSGEKSLEMMQSLLVSAYWHFPPERYEQLKYSQYVHMSTTMAMDMGLGVPELDVPTVTLDSTSALSTERRQVADGMERRRTWLGCYVTCTSLKRPSMLFHSPYTAECMKILETSPEAAPYDNRLVAWAKLQHIMEPLNISVLATVNASSYLADPRARYLFGGIRKRLHAWSIEYPVNVVGPNLRIAFDHYKLCLLEIVLHADHDLEDFRPPFRLRKSRARRDETMNSMDPIYAEAVADCLSSAHSILDLFCGMDPRVVRSLPTVTYVRTVYAVVVLIKLLQSATDQYSQLGPFVDLASIQIERYMGGLYNHLIKVSDHGKCHVGNKFLGALIAIRAWCCKIVSQQNSSEEQTDELIEPLLHLNLSPDPKLCPHRTLGGVTLENKKFPSAPAPSTVPPKQTTSPEWTPASRTTSNQPSKEKQSQTSSLPQTSAAPQTSTPTPSSNLQYFIPNPNFSASTSNPPFPYNTASLPDFPSPDQQQTSPHKETTPTNSNNPFSFDPTIIPNAGSSSAADIPMDPFPSETECANYYTTEYALDEMEGWMPDLEFIEGLDLSSFLQPAQQAQDWAGFARAEGGA